MDCCKCLGCTNGGLYFRIVANLVVVRGGCTRRVLKEGLYKRDVVKKRVVQRGCCTKKNYNV